MKKWILIFLCLLLALPLGASQLREIGWEDLEPKIEFDDPFTKLSQQQLADLGFVARIRARDEKKEKVSDSTRAEGNEIEAELIEAGVDIDGLLAQRDEIRKLREKRATSVVSELDREEVRMPGFMLPLEFNERKVTEFLLVPWVGACIHTPPPPPNQIVHVVLEPEEAVEAEGRFTPVWVNGQMQTVASTSSLYLVDGAGNIQTAYQLNATLVEPYTNSE